ncbi:MAG: hypothetical protein MAG715_00404 [Methanonatronarchaeales archaeon]|nr:hypothetical protein [Methanonatronarchaeales archaeon]
MLRRVREGVLEGRRLRLLVIGANLAGAAFGIHYYRGQLLSTEWFLLPFVPDSSIAVGLFGVALWLQVTGRKRRLLSYLAGCLSVTYGAWTLAVLFLDPSYYFNPVGSTWFLFNLFLIALPHFGMVLQPVLLELEDVDMPGVAAVLSLLLLNWAVDYGLGTHTAIPEGLVHGASALELLLLVSSALLLPRYREALLRV